MKQSYDIKPAPRCMYSEIGTRCTRLSCIKRWRSSKSCMFSIAAANTFFSFLHQPVDLGMAVAVLACGGKGSGVFVLEDLCAGDTAAVPASKLNHSCKPNVVCTDHGGGAFVSVPRLQGFLFFVCNECFGMKTLEARYWRQGITSYFCLIIGVGFFISAYVLQLWWYQKRQATDFIGWILYLTHTVFLKCFFIPECWLKARLPVWNIHQTFILIWLSNVRFLNFIQWITIRPGANFSTKYAHVRGRDQYGKAVHGDFARAFRHLSTAPHSRTASRMGGCVGIRVCVRLKFMGLWFYCGSDDCFLATTKK